MSDKIQDAITSYKAGKERVARGDVDGHRIYIIKRRELLRWKFIIEVDGSTEYKTSGNKQSLESDFNYYKSQYDLEEVE